MHTTILMKILLTFLVGMMVLLGIMQYSSNLLREIQKKARTNYEDFKIDKATRVWIIVLKIRKTAMGHTYR